MPEVGWSGRCQSHQEPPARRLLWDDIWYHCKDLGDGKARGLCSLSLFFWFFFFSFYGAEHMRHQKQSTANKQTIPLKALENSTPNGNQISNIEVGWGWMVCVSELERGNEQVRSSCPPPQLSCLQQCKGNEGSKEMCSPHREVMLSRVLQVSVGQNCTAFSALLGCCKSPLSLRWSLLWGITEGRRFRGGQETLGGGYHRALAALPNSGNPFGAIC